MIVMTEKIQVSGMRKRLRLNKLGVSKVITNILSGREASKLLKSLLRSKRTGKEQLSDMAASTEVQIAA